MAKKAKVRKEDFSHKEMEELTGLTRKAFDDALQKICEMYGFDICDFKTVADEEKSGYFFPPETAELIALLIRHLSEHPMTRANADTIKITANQLSDYYKALIEDIDERIPQVFKEIIYCRPSHLVAQRIANWTLPFVKQLTYFLVNLTTLQYEDVGAALRDFTRKLDEMNYCLFRGNYLKAKAYSANIETVESLYPEYVQEASSESVSRLTIQNAALDSIIAEVLRLEIEKAKEIRSHKFPGLKKMLDEDNWHRKFIGEEIELIDKDGRVLFKEIEDPSEEDLREAYYEYIVRNNDSMSQFAQAEYIINYCRERDSRWKSTDEAIRNKEFAEPQEKSIEERKTILKRNIQIATKELEEYKQMLEELEQQTEEPEKSALLAEIQEEYSKHCTEVDREYPELQNIVDRFVGQALQQVTR